MIVTRREKIYLAVASTVAVASFAFGTAGFLLSAWVWFVVGLWFALVAITANFQAFLDGLKVAVMIPLYLLLCIAMLCGFVAGLCGLWDVATMPVASMPVGALFCLLLIVLGAARR